MLAIEHLARSELADHPCWASAGIEAYVGTRVVVRGEPFGSLSFPSARPAGRSFDLADQSFVLPVSSWPSNLVDSHGRIPDDDERA